MSADILDERVTSAGDTTFPVDVLQPDAMELHGPVELQMTRTGARDAGATFILQGQASNAHPGSPMTDEAFLALRYREGQLLPIETQRMTTEERAELEQLIERYSQGESLSEILLEERRAARD